VGRGKLGGHLSIGGLEYVAREIGLVKKQG
jgi:hypothetical protein